jgi:hypothetical protein
VGGGGGGSAGVGSVAGGGSAGGGSDGVVTGRHATSWQGAGAGAGSVAVGSGAGAVEAGASGEGGVDVVVVGACSVEPPWLTVTGVGERRCGWRRGAGVTMVSARPPSETVMRRLTGR